MSNRTDIVVETDNAEGQVLLSASRVYDLTEDKTQDTINSEVGSSLTSLGNTLNSVVTTVNSFVPSAKITRTSQETGTINCPSASRHFLLITSSFATVYWFGYLIVASNGTPTAVEFIKGGDTTVATSTNIFSITSGRGSTSWVIADIILLGNACS